MHFRHISQNTLCQRQLLDLFDHTTKEVFTPLNQKSAICKVQKINVPTNKHIGGKKTKQRVCSNFELVNLETYFSSKKKKIHWKNYMRTTT